MDNDESKKSEMSSYKRKSTYFRKSKRELSPSKVVSDSPEHKMSKIGDLESPQEKNESASLSSTTASVPVVNEQKTQDSSTSQRKRKLITTESESSSSITSSTTVVGEQKTQDSSTSQGKKKLVKNEAESSSLITSSTTVAHTKADSNALQETKLTSKKDSDSQPSSLTAHAPDIYQLEEDESESYSSEEICGEFTNTCKELSNKIAGFVKTIQERSSKVSKLESKTKNASSVEASTLMEETKLDMLEMSAVYMDMKRLNRLDKHCLKRSRDKLNEKKQKLDHLNLHFQNLQYEASYLQKEVTLITELNSQTEELELLGPVKEFADEMIKPDMSEQERYELVIKRLQGELELRKSLATKLHNADIRKRQIENEVSLLNERLDSVVPMLDNVIQAVSSIPSLHQFPNARCFASNNSAKPLPNLLYHLYTDLCTYQAHKDKAVTVNTFGSADNLRIFNRKNDDSGDDSGDSDQNDGAKAAHHKRFISATSAKDFDAALKVHPLSVLLTVFYEGHNIGLKFECLTELNFVTVSIKQLHIAAAYSGDSEVAKVLCLETFLDSLLPGDDGKVYCQPNIHVSSKMIGKPYLWCQKIAGMNLSLPSDVDSDKLHDRSQFLTDTILAIRLRLKARVLLSSEIAALVGRCKLPSEIADISAPKLIAQLKKFASVSWSHVMAHPSIKELMDLGIIINGSMVYEAVVERGSAKLTALVLIADNYPEKTPFFLLSLRWKGEHNSTSNLALRDMERELNGHFVQEFPEQYKKHLLVAQMHHLRACLDIYVETEYVNDLVLGPREFMKEKPTTNDFRGRARQRPYRFLPRRNIFDQRST